MKQTDIAQTIRRCTEVNRKVQQCRDSVYKEVLEASRDPKSVEKRVMMAVNNDWSEQDELGKYRDRLKVKKNREDVLMKICQEEIERVEEMKEEMKRNR
jgi:hypothetical protein